MPRVVYPQWKISLCLKNIGGFFLACGDYGGRFNEPLPACILGRDGEGGVGVSADSLCAPVPLF